MIGKVKFYNSAKKFGFIEVHGSSTDYFFHINDVTGQNVRCVDGEDIEFDAVESKKKPGTFEAKNVRHPDGYKNTVFKLKGRPSSYLFQWAFIQLDDIDADDGTTKKGVLHDLARVALKEDWAYGHFEKRYNTPFPILRNYLINTFFKLYRDGETREVSHAGDNWAAFNTGLVNELYDPIYALFEKNSQPPRPWKFHAFCSANIGRAGQVLVRNFNPLPKPARYFDKLDQVIFDPEVEIAPRYDHIVYDSIARGRYPVEFLKKHCPKSVDWIDVDQIPKEDREKYLSGFVNGIKSEPRVDRDIRNRVDDAIELAVKRARWNFKTAIPLYYPRTGNISLLLPIALVDDERVDLALVITRTAAGGYSGETVYKLNWAYDHARLVCRPDSDWLTRQADDEDDEDEE
jgi:cold shock CspA family protein